MFIYIKIYIHIYCTSIYIVCFISFHMKTYILMFIHKLIQTVSLYYDNVSLLLRSP